MVEQEKEGREMAKEEDEAGPSLSVVMEIALPQTRLDGVLIPRSKDAGSVVTRTTHVEHAPSTKRHEQPMEVNMSTGHMKLGKKAKQKPPVKAAIPSDAATDSEDSECDEPTEGILRKVKGFGLTPTANSFGALGTAPAPPKRELESWAHRVVEASQKRSQKSKCQKVMTVRTEADIDKVVDEFRIRRVNGLINTPKFVKVSSLEAGPGWRWIMVDSRSAEHCLDAEAELPDHEVEPSPGQEIGQTVETAGGHELANLGQVRVEFETQEGLESDVTFQNIKVTTPILSVRKLVKKGHEVEFRRGGGSIVAAGSGERMNFIERGGVYYIKLKIRPPVSRNSQPGFTRRG